MSAPTLERPLAEVAPEPVETGAVPARSARLAAAFAVLALLAAVLALPAGSLLAPAPFASLVAGSLEVRDGEGWRTVAVGGSVQEGAELRAVGGAATLDADGGRLVLGAGARATALEGRLVVERGSVLVDDPAVRTLVVDGVEASGRGAWRVDAGARPRLATYDGSLVGADGSVEVPLPAYRQVTVRDRALGGATVVPLRYLATDLFDTELLAEAFRVDAVAAALARSLGGTYGEVAREASFYDAFLPATTEASTSLVELAPVVEDGRLGPPAEVLLGVVVADAVAAAAGLTGQDALEQVIGLRSEGATWGLTVVDAGAGADDLGAAADRALSEAAADPPPTTPPVPADDTSDAGTETDTPSPAAGSGTPEPAGSPGSAGGTGGAGGEGPGGSGGTVPAPPPTPTPDPPLPEVPAPELPAPVDEVVDEAGRGVGDLLDGVGGTVGGAVDGAREGLDRGLGGGLGGGLGRGLGGG